MASEEQNDEVLSKDRQQISRQADPFVKMEASNDSPMKAVALF